MINVGKFEHKIQQVFGLAKTSTVKEDETFPKDPHFLRYPGYPTLNGMCLFLTLSGLEQWQTKKNLDFQNKCCVCLKKAQYFLPCYEKTGFWNLGRKIVILDDIPHCPIHGQEKQAQLIATSYPLREGRVIMITLIGMNADFLTETFDLNQKGDVIPPWQAFPEYPWGSINW